MQLPIASQPIVAITIKQRDAAAQADVDRAAVGDAAADAYWKALAAALRERAPGLAPLNELKAEAFAE